MSIGARRYRSKRLASEAVKIVAAGIMALSVSACSTFSYSVIGLNEDEPEVTGAITPRAAVVPTLSPDLNEEDWRRAKSALGLALDPQGPGTLVSWDNPESALKGTFTAKGAPYVKDDEICRAFTAHVSGSPAQSLQGFACRPSGGDWAIKDIKPAQTAPDKSAPARTAPARATAKIGVHAGPA